MPVATFSTACPHEDKSNLGAFVTIDQTGLTLSPENALSFLSNCKVSIPSGQ
jgi:hypothetical protein